MQRRLPPDAGILRTLLGCLTAAALVASPAFAQAQQAPAVPLIGPQGAAPAPAPESPPGEAPVEEPEAPDMESQSIFFNAQEIRRIKEALAAFETQKMRDISAARNQAREFISKLEDSKKEAPVKKGVYYPQFFLQSLFYQGPDDWMIVVNQNRITPQNRNEGWLKVIGVEKDRVLFEWHPADMASIKQSWKTAQNETALVNAAKGTVSFALHPNQTFSSFAMRVLEGKVAPVRYDSVINDAKGVALEILKEPVSKPDRDEPPRMGSGEGLEGLIRTYKKLGLEQQQRNR